MRSGEMLARGEILEELEPGDALLFGWRKMTDPLMQRIVSEVRARFVYATGHNPPERIEHLRAAMREAAALHKGDLFLDWMHGLPPWAGTKRVERLFIDALDAEDTPLTRAAAQVLLLAALARSYQPGTDHHLVPVLGGAQSGGKSSLVRGLLPPELQQSHFADNVDLAVPAKVIAEQIGSALFVEFAEMNGAYAAGVPLGKLKSFLSSPSDRYRSSYGLTTQEHPRMWAGVGTVNPDERSPGFLPADPTGARRWIAVKVGKPGRGWVMEYCDLHREQLWAEALAMYRDGEIHWLSPELEQLQEETNKGLMASQETIDDAFDKFITWYESGEAGEYGTPYRMEVIMEHAGLSLDKEQNNQNALGVILINRGWTKRERRLSDGKARRWYPSAPSFPVDVEPTEPPPTNREELAKKLQDQEDV